MRLQRLDLIRYGHFTGRSFDLPAGEFDFYIIFGPNEAGKSTVLAALEDLLFGIPKNSSYNFLHDYDRMRIGGNLEDGSSSLEVLRRKGNKNTLLGTDGQPILGGEGALSPYLAGADRSFFERMFSLDHARLQTGGKEILDAKDDIGQMLFSAGAGIVGLRECLGELSAEADELWSVKRSKYRKFYSASDKLKEAQRILREQTFTTNKWRELKRAYEEAKDAYAKVDKKIKENSAERNRLSRIRRVFQDVRSKQELDSQLAELGDVITLPEDAAKVVAEAELEDTRAVTSIETLQEQLEIAEKNLQELTFDETLVQRGEDIDLLHEKRIEIRREKADLPKREAELNAAEQELRANAAELEWEETDSEALIDRIPPRTKVHVVRSLLNQKGKLEADVRSHTRVLQESQETLGGLKGHLEKMSEPADMSRLAIVIKTLREQGDLTGQVRNAEQALKGKQELVERRFKALNPGDTDEEMLTNMTVPAQAMVQEHQKREQDWKRRLRETQQEVSSVQQELDRTVAAFDRSVRDENVVTGEEVGDARSHRNALWKLLKLKHVQGEPIPENEAHGLEGELEDLAGAFEPAMDLADDLADRRFDHAEAAGQIAEIKRKIEEQKMLLKQKKENETKCVEEGVQLRAEWTTMWALAPFDPLTAESMFEWLEARKKVLEAIEERERAESALGALRSKEREAREQVLSELEALGVDVAGLENDNLNVIIEFAAEEQRLRETEFTNKAQLQKNVENVTNEVARKERDLRKAEEDQDEWKKKWANALCELGLAKDTTPEAVEAQIEVIDQMRETARTIRSLRHERIDKINRNVANFEQVAGDLVKDLAQDLLDPPAENAVLELEKRLAEAKHTQGLREKKKEEVERLKIQIAKLENKRRELATSISHLKTAAAVETNEALKETIGRSDQQRSVKQKRQQIIEKLKQDGDGKSIDELVEECKDTVIDEVVARDASIQNEFEDLQNQQAAAAGEQSRAREAFQAIGGDDAAARAAASKQEALAEMQQVAERYVRVKTSAILLQWAIDRYRREKQAPLLKRAGELFRIITSDSFSSLQVEFDDKDKAHLMGVRPSGSIVPVSGMSTGTADQLYLALRVASIEDYLERAKTLPFVADDLFINFDDERAAAGFALLGELSQTTQVLFFTHHRHLVDIAQKSLGASVSIVTLPDQKVAAV